MFPSTTTIATKWNSSIHKKKVWILIIKIHYERLRDKQNLRPYHYSLHLHQRLVFSIFVLKWLLRLQRTWSLYNIPSHQPISCSWRWSRLDFPYHGSAIYGPHIQSTSKPSSHLSRLKWGWKCLSSYQLKETVIFAKRTEELYSHN